MTGGRSVRAIKPIGQGVEKRLNMLRRRRTSEEPPRTVA